jgi:hypothetical protein
VLIDLLERLTDCILQRTKDIIILMSSSAAPEETMGEVAPKAASTGDALLKEEEVIDSEESETTSTGTPPLKEEKAISTEDSKEDQHEEEGDDDDLEIVSLRKQVFLFHHMAIHPWFYMLFWPILFSFLIGFGWTQDDIIEDEVTNIWIPTSGSYHDDLAYAESLGENDLPTTNFAAMSIARDGGNLFTESRLNEIMARMEKTEQTTVRKEGRRGASCLLLDSQSHSLFYIVSTHSLHYITDRIQGRHVQLGRFLLEQWRLSVRISLRSLVSHGFVSRVALVLQLHGTRIDSCIRLRSCSEARSLPTHLVQGVDPGQTGKPAHSTIWCHDQYMPHTVSSCTRLSFVANLARIFAFYPLC